MIRGRLELELEAGAVHADRHEKCCIDVHLLHLRERHVRTVRLAGVLEIARPFRDVLGTEVGYPRAARAIRVESVDLGVDDHHVVLHSLS